MTALETISAALDYMEQILCERMCEAEDEIIKYALLNSVSPVVTIDYLNGIRLSVNRDDYGLNEIARLTHEYGNHGIIYIDGKDIFADD